MAREHRSSTERFKYGICLNDECPKCKSKEVQQIPLRKDLVCTECGKELRECPPPKKGGNMSIILGAVAVIVIGGGIAAYTMMGGSSESNEIVLPDTTAVTSEKVDTTAADVSTPTDVETPKEADNEVKQKPVQVAPAEPKPAQPAQPSSGNKNLGYAKFTGSLKSGQPHGQGRMTFISSHVIDSRDSKGRVADAGDYVIGEWNNGNLVQGRWYGSDGNVKGSIIIGM